MKFNIFPPEALKSIEPKFHVEPRAIAKTIERELQKKPLAGLYTLDGSARELPVSLLDFAQGLLVMKPEIKPEGGLTSLVGGQRLVVQCGDTGKM